MEENQVFENKIVVDNNSFLNFVAIYQSLIRYCSEEETMDIIETIEKSLDNDSINFRMEKKIKPYLFINGKTTVKWSWRLDKHKLSHVKSITKYIKAGLNDMYPQLGIPHPIYDVYLVGMYEFWKPKKWDIYKLNTTKYSYARTEVNQRIINLSNKIRTLFIDENELCFQKNVRKLLPCGTRPIEGEATSKYFYYFQEKDVLRVADKLHPNKLNNFHTLQADKVFIQGVEVSSEETNNNQINSFGHKDTARILFDGEGYISLLGLYKICKRKEDADFIYNLIITNQQKSDSIDIFIFLDGYELVLKKKNIFNLGIPIDDDYSLIARLASKINKEVDEPKIALKFTGLFIYKNYQNILPYIVPCQESYVNMTKISYEFQRNVEFQLLEEYLDSNSCDGKVLPQSTQFYDCESLGLNSIHQNYLYFFEGDIVKIIKKYFSPEDQLNFFKIEVDRIFEAAKEVFIDSEEIKEDKDVYGFGISSYSHNQPVSNYDFSFNENTLDFSSNYSPVINKSKHEQTEIGVLTPIKKSNFKSTVSSFFGFILSLNQEGFQKESDIYNYFFNKYKEINWCKTIQLFMNTESENNFQVKERVSELFIAALVELVREDINIRRYRNKGNIYSDYEKFRKDKAWKESRITPFISSATKELSEYLK